MTLPEIAIKFALQQEGIDTVIPGMRNAWQAKANTAVTDLPDLPKEITDKISEKMKDLAGFKKVDISKE